MCKTTNTEALKLPTKEACKAQLHCGLCSLSQGTYYLGFSENTEQNTFSDYDNSLKAVNFEI